jgi:hypothetical protein
VLSSVVGEARVSKLRGLVDSGRRDEAVAHLRDEILPSGSGITQLVDDLIVALSKD